MRAPSEAAAALATEKTSIARGNGRAYGDSALNKDCVISTLKSDRILSFDPGTGTIVCEAGLLLDDLLEFAVPRGFFPPVVPGTKFVTVGGMIAADVHGKNHHGAGSFSAHVDWLELLLPDGTIVTASRMSAPDLFAATCGGMGLTGLILSLSFRLMRIPSAAIRQETLRTGSLSETLALIEASSDWRYTVAWVDSLARGSQLGRAVLHRGDHARPDETGAMRAPNRKRTKIRVPFDPPSGLLNAWTVQLFNALYYRRNRPGAAVVDYDAYFFPLDGVLGWNRLYGSRGFLQYQCVIPRRTAETALHEILELITASRQGSFLTVLKLLGPEGLGPLSFPLEGYTLAMDFPNVPATHSLFAALDQVVRKHSGRLYLAKDARMSRELLESGYPRLTEFLRVRRSVPGHEKIASLQSERLGL